MSMNNLNDAELLYLFISDNKERLDITDMYERENVNDEFEHYLVDLAEELERRSLLDLVAEVIVTDEMPAIRNSYRFSNKSLSAMNDVLSLTARLVEDGVDDCEFKQELYEKINN